VGTRSMDLARRHGALRERIAEQRRTLAGHAGPLERALGNADKALAGVEWVKTHPQVVGVAVAVVVVASPKRAWRWGKRFYFVWRGWQSLRNSLLAAS
jgi:YqjK-like protein